MNLDIAQINFGLIIQGLIVAIIIGMFYTVWVSTRTYGGLIGNSVKVLAFGILLITIAVIEKMLINFNAISYNPTTSIFQDVLNLLGLSLLFWGFSKLASATKV